MKSAKELHSESKRKALVALNHIYFDNEVSSVVVVESLKELRLEIDRMLVTFGEMEKK